MGNLHMAEIIWKGKTKKGSAIEISMEDEDDCLVLNATDIEGKVLETRYGYMTDEGEYDLESPTDEFATLSSDNQSAEHKNEEISSILVALALKIICEKGGKRAIIHNVSNWRWCRWLTEKMGGFRGPQEFPDIIWDGRHLTLPEQDRQKWHDFLPK